MLYRELLGGLTSRLGQVDSPRLSAELLIALVLGLSREELLKQAILCPDLDIPEKHLPRLESLALRRQAGEPMAYILGKKEFYGRDFLVTPQVLIPRPETELLIETALAGTVRKAGRFADFGTGSGCIALTLALELPAWMGLALDISLAAVHVARTNAARLGVSGLNLIQADFTHPPLADNSLDLLVSNPPYIGDAEYRNLDPEVREYEPVRALVPGFRPEGPDPSEPTGPVSGQNTQKAGGLEDVALIVRAANRLLAEGGRLLVEIGHGQEEGALGLLAAPPWREAKVMRDLAGLPRLLSAVKG